MGLETGTYITDLNTANPVGTTDAKSDGDNHLRLIKSTLKNSFPSFTGLIIGTGTAGGTADALALTLSPAPTSYTNNMMLMVRAAAANATTAPTINVNAIGAITITKNGGSALAAGDIAGANHTLLLQYNSTAARFELLNPALVIGANVQAYDADIPTVAASQAEMEAGTEAALRSMSPLRVAQAVTALSDTLPSQTGNAGKSLITNGTTESWDHPAKLSSAGGSAPSYSARAWVVFNGSTAAIVNSANVASISKNGSGDYTLNFSTAMTSASGYVVLTTTNLIQTIYAVSTRATTSVRILYRDVNNTPVDPTDISVAIFE